MRYKEISASEFTKLNCSVLFDDEKTGRRFGVIYSEVNVYKFSWQSDSVDPIFLINEIGMFCCVGVDQSFSIVEFKEKGAQINLKLDYFLYDIKYIGRKIWVITELEILIINTLNYEIFKTIPLPSFFKTINIEDSIATVKCVEEEVLQIEIS